MVRPVHFGPTRPHTPEQLAARLKLLLARCERSESGCLIWKGLLNRKGYGTTSFESKHWMTHRLAYALVKGPIPQGALICHRCDTPACCEPEHLFLGDYKTNMEDMTGKGRHYLSNRTHCPRGHEFTPENTYVSTRPDRPGGIHRACRTCVRARQNREWHEWRKDYHRKRRAAKRQPQPGGAEHG